MDQRQELQLQSLGICNKIFNFITRNITHQALKTVTLGSSQQDQMVHPLPQPQSQSQDLTDQHEDFPETDHVTVCAPNPMAPKKSVSINDRVEEIKDAGKAGKRKKKIKKQTQKLNSLDLEVEEEEELKPLKSILKVGSKLYENSNSFAYQSTN